MYGLKEDSNVETNPSPSGNINNKRKLNIAVFGGDEQSFLTRNMVTRFNETGNIANIYSIKNHDYQGENVEINAMALFIDSSFLEERAALININQFAMAKDIPIFLLGLPMDISFMFLTAADDANTVKEIMRLRPVAYLLKTMAPAEIISVVDNFFRTAKLS